MDSDLVHLRVGARDMRSARLRSLTGHDELALSQADFAGAVPIISGLIVEDANGVCSSETEDLPIDDYDRLLAAVFERYFGEAAEIQMACPECGERFEMSVVLADAFPSLADPEPVLVDEVHLAGGTRIRSLRLGDLLAAEAHGDQGVLVDRAVTKPGSDDEQVVVNTLEKLAPTATEEVHTQCPACNTPLTCLFDLSKFLLASWRRERGMLLREVHLLARQYGWSLSEILSMERTMRQEMVALVTASTAANQRMQAV